MTAAAQAHDAVRWLSVYDAASRTVNFMVFVMYLVLTPQAAFDGCSYLTFCVFVFLLVA